MTDTDRNIRARSFGSVAEDYARYRPAPPREAAEWAVGGGADVMVDLAAGTGNLSGHLVGVGAGSVMALDLDLRMLQVLQADVTDAAPVVARGEVLPLKSASVGAVAVSSAWHWLDHELAWPELARVIRPGGTLAVLHSGPDRSHAWVRDVLDHRARGPADTGSGPRPGWAQRRAVAVPDRIPFSGVEERIFESSIAFPRADLPGLAASYSRVIILDEKSRHRVMAGVAARAASHPELAGSTVDLPLRCRVWRAVRTPQPGSC